MADKDLRNFIVVWSPMGFGYTVNEMKIIDAFATASLSYAKSHMTSKLLAGEYVQYGDGNIEVVETKINNRYRSPDRMMHGSR